MRAAKKSVVITDGTGDILQIVICLFACDYLRYIVLQYVEPRIPENGEMVWQTKLGEIHKRTLCNQSIEYIKRLNNKSKI